MKVKQSIKLALTGIAAKGMAVGRTSSGVVVFVKDAVPGDIAMVYLYKKRKSYFEGRLEKLISPSQIECQPNAVILESVGVASGNIYRTLVSSNTSKKKSIKIL